MLSECDFSLLVCWKHRHTLLSQKDPAKDVSDKRRISSIMQIPGRAFRSFKTLKNIRYQCYANLQVRVIVFSHFLYYLWVQVIIIRLIKSLRGGSKTAATFKVKLFEILVNGWKSLTVTVKSSTLDVAAVLDPPLSLTATGFEPTTT